MTSRSGWTRLTAVLLVAVALLLIGRLLPLADAIGAVRGWVAGAKGLGPLVFGALYVTASLLLVPGSAITLAAGALFGVPLGSLVVALSATVAAALAFVLARTFLRGHVTRAIAERPKLVAVDEAVTSGGWRVVGLLRLSPAVPYGVLNYALGATGVGFLPAVLVSAVAMLPGTLLYVTLGATGADAALGVTRTPGGWALLAVGLAATVLVTVLLTRAARERIGELQPSEPTPEDTTTP